MILYDCNELKCNSFHFFYRIYAVDKVQALKRYKFSLAFENSNEEDYVTEKYFQSLVAGTNLLHNFYSLLRFMTR